MSSPLSLSQKKATEGWSCYWKLLGYKTLRWGFPGGSVVENLPAMQETRLRSLGGEDPLEKGMATHSRILAWRIPWTEEPGGLQSLHGVTKNQTRNEKFSLYLLQEENRGSERLDDLFGVTQLISGRVGVWFCQTWWGIEQHLSHDPWFASQARCVLCSVSGWWLGSGPLGDVCSKSDSLKEHGF